MAYGIGKAAVDRMAADCAVELRKHNVAMISLWPGPVKTEYVAAKVEKSEYPIDYIDDNSLPDRTKNYYTVFINPYVTLKSIFVKLPQVKWC